jgi:Domain of unknown function (DUF4166)
MTMQTSCEIYKRLLGSDWSSLAEAIRLAHKSGVERTGVFSITRNDGFIARFVLVLSQMPKSATGTRTRLRITVQNQIEIWERWFGTERLMTRQWTDRNGLLVERFGTMEFQFALRPHPPDLLRYEQRGSRVHFGPLSLPVPKVLAPSVSATETAESPTRVRIHVEVKLPLIGRLIAYDGYLEVGGDRV